MNDELIGGLTGDQVDLLITQPEIGVHCQRIEVTEAVFVLLPRPVELLPGVYPLVANPGNRVLNHTWHTEGNQRVPRADSVTGSFLRRSGQVSAYFSQFRAVWSDICII